MSISQIYLSPCYRILIIKWWALFSMCWSFQFTCQFFFELFISFPSSKILHWRVVLFYQMRYSEHIHNEVGCDAIVIYFRTPWSIIKEIVFGYFHYIHTCICFYVGTQLSSKPRTLSIWKNFSQPPRLTRESFIAICDLAFNNIIFLWEWVRI